MFWRLANADPHKALSFDRLHSNSGGLWGRHLWDAFKDYIAALPRHRDAEVAIDEALVSHSKLLLEVATDS